MTGQPHNTYPGKEDGELNTIFDGLNGFVESLGDRVRAARARDGGSYSRHYLDRPIKVGKFGIYRAQLNYLDGLRVKDQLGRDIKVIRATLKTNSGENVAMAIGKTPDQDNPSKGGTALPNAGQPSGLLLAIKRPGEEETKYRYLQPADIEGMTLIPGEPIEFGFNPARNQGQGGHLRIGAPGIISYVAQGIVGYE